MASNQPIRKGANGFGSEIPDKLYFRIGEVARLCEVPAYVLRFWEGEFPQLKPNKGGTGQRLYRRRDVEMAIRIKRLLYDEGYTIPGARQVFKAEIRHKEPQLALAGTGAERPATDLRRLQGLRRELQEIAAILAQPPGEAPKARAVQSIRAQWLAAEQATVSGTPTRHPARARREPADRPLFDLLSNPDNDAGGKKNGKPAAD